MMDLEIVTHCYSGEAVPIYHKLLCYQLSSLLLHRPEISVRITVCFTPNDRLTEKVLDHFVREFEMQDDLELNYYPMWPEDLFRRARGRNLVALKSEADVIWFTDVDHVFGEQCLDTAHKLARLAYAQNHDVNMVYPASLKINETHAKGDDALARLGNSITMSDIRCEDFVLRKNKRAWGGLQIVRGDWCRVHGYLDKTKWNNRVNPARGFRQCKCDVPFRKAVGESVAVSIPNLYRIRHSRAGRDGGEKDHGAT